MKKLIITPTNQYIIDMPQKEINNRLLEIDKVKEEEEEEEKKKQKKELALQRLKTSSNQDIKDLLELIN